MAYDLEEQEKIDALKDWWDKNGAKVIAAACIFAAAVLGWRGYQWYEQHQATKAMGYFEALEVAATQSGTESTERILAASEVLRKDHAKSGYTSRGLLIAAEALYKQGELEPAKSQLQWLIEQNKEAAIVGIARLRLAGMLLEQADYEAALKQLQQPTPAFVGLYADRRGDIYYAQSKFDLARKEWSTASTELQDVAYLQIVQLKLDALGKE